MARIKELLELYERFNGGDGFVLLYFAGLLWLYFHEKKESRRTILVYGGIGTLVFIFFPPVYMLYERFVDAGTYWRFFWLLPVGIVLSYAATELLYEKKSMLTPVLLLLILVTGGRFVYTGVTNGEREKATNAYQIPQRVVDMIDDMEEARRPDEELKAAFPPELLVYVRQYDTDIFMPYGREMLDPHWSETNGFFEAMSAPSLDFERLGEKSELNHVRFLAVNRAKPQENDPEEYGFTLFGSYEYYFVYEYHKPVH